MNKKFVSGMLLLIFSTGTINLHASLPEKIASIKQKLKNSIQKVTLKDVVYCTTTAAIVIGVALIIEWRQRKTEDDHIYITLAKQNLRIFDLDYKLKQLASRSNINLDSLLIKR